MYLGTGPVRGLWEQDGRAFAVSGPNFYEIFPSQTKTLRGSVRANTWPATISSNGSFGDQLIVTSGGNGYLYGMDDHSFAEILDAAFPTRVQSCLYFDGYFIALDARTGIFSLSDLNDGSSWNGLDFGQEMQVSDQTKAMARSHDNLFLFGSKYAVPWFNNGDASFPFAPVSGTLIEQGIFAPWSLASLDNTLFWVGGDDRGKGIVWRFDGYTPVRVSTNPVEFALSQASRLEDAIGFSYQEEGHLFYLLYVPTLDTTWVYDVATQQWHERAEWDSRTMRWYPHRARCHAFAFGKHLVGDRKSGMIYEQRLDLYTDDVVDV